MRRQRSPAQVFLVARMRGLGPPLPCENYDLNWNQGVLAGPDGTRIFLLAAVTKLFSLDKISD